MTSPNVVPDKTPDPAVCTEELEQNDIDDEKVADLLTRNEISRCFSLPNIDGFKQVEDFDSNHECNLNSGEWEGSMFSNLEWNVNNAYDF